MRHFQIGLSRQTDDFDCDELGDFVVAVVMVVADDDAVKETKLHSQLSFCEIIFCDNEVRGKLNFVHVFPWIKSNSI